MAGFQEDYLMENLTLLSDNPGAMFTKGLILVFKF